MAESAEGARLLSEYRGKTSIVGSNPTLSAFDREFPGFFYAESAESRPGGMLSEYRGKTSIVGSNPTLSASDREFPVFFMPSLSRPKFT